MRGRSFLIACLLAAAAFLLVAPRLRAAPEYHLEDAFPGVTFDRPVFAAQAPDGTPRMFVVEQGGKVFTVPHPAGVNPGKTLYFDLSDAVSRIGNEEGLLGLAFHPNFAQNRRFFVQYSAAYAQTSQRRVVVCEFLQSATDASTALRSSERLLLSMQDPFENHNGGWLGFDMTGKLLVATGDGGSAGDPQDNGQNLGSLLGKILRLDVDGAQPYAIPSDNPFVGRSGAREEVYAYGLRNPWRCSIDPVTGALWAGDVGQDRWEEVDRVVAGGNYGWDTREGFNAHEAQQGPPPDPYIDPITVYDHAVGRSITGGHVYRGALLPDLAGKYVYGDFETGRMFAISDPYGTPASADLLNTPENIASFAVDRAGELYVCTFGGTIRQLRDDTPPEPVTVLPAKLSELGVFADLPSLTPVATALPYSVRTKLWSDGASKERFLLLPPGAAMTWDDEDAFAVPQGTLAVKTFERAGERLETRIILRTASGFEAATYRWSQDLTNADRLDDRVVASAGGGTWTYPSPDDCRLCHTDSAGFLLGVRARQLPASTLKRWKRDGKLTGAPKIASVDRNVPLGRGGRATARARSYLDANCSFCHRPDDPTNAGLDLRATTLLEDTGALDTPPQHGDAGVANARIIAPGEPARSTLAARMRILGDGRMPQIATQVPDDQAIRVIERWIKALR